MEKVVGFFGPRDFYGVFSNFYPAPFRIDGRQFWCTEQYIMFQKAMLFGDTDIATEIMFEQDPLKCKRLGRKVRHFDSAMWEQKCEDLVFPGMLAKFQQNPECRAILLETGDAIICECAPRDKIWGIGMGVTNTDYKNPSLWRGRNRQGKLLMRVRDALQGSADR